jgi:hypothetical protein
VDPLYSFALGEATRLFALLLHTTTRPLAAWWWSGPLLVLFAWITVPIMRCRHNLEDYSRATRFWWSPVWPGAGLIGLGLCLVASPLLNPILAAKWTPLFWTGVSANLSLVRMGLLVVFGIIAMGAGLSWIAHAWLRDRDLRYRAWRWRQGMQAAKKGW